MKTFFTIIFSVLALSNAIAQDKILSASLIDNSKIADNGLYFNGTSGVDYQFSPRISPHGDCIDVVNGYVFVTWYKGGMDKRNVMLSRKKLDDPTANWVTIEFPHQHVGYRGTDPTKGDSHNTIAIGVSTIDGTIHLLYDMHAYSETSLPNDFFNYSVSEKNKAFVPDSEFNLSIFKPKQNYLKSGENYNRITYPMLHRAGDGSLLVRYRVGGSGNGDIFMAHYDGSSWSNNWLFHDGTLPLPDRNNMYGGERFLNGKFYSGFSIRYANNNTDTPTNGYTYNSGLYYAYTNGIPKDQSTQWFDVNDNLITLPIKNNLDPNLDPVQIGQPGDDYGTTTNPRTTSDPAWTVTENGAIHFVTRVDNINVHYYKKALDANFSSNSGGLIPNSEVRGEIYSYKNHVFMVELLAGKVNVKSTLEGQNDWKIVFTDDGTENFMHFDAFVEGNKLYVYLMENTSGDARPLHLKVFNLSEVDAPVVELPDYIFEAENFTTASSDIFVEDNPAASNAKVIGSFASNQFLEYKFQVTSPGTYDFILFAANRNRDDSIMDIEINGVLYNSVLITRSFDWNVFLETTIPNINLVLGENVIRLTQKRSLSSEPDKIELYLKTTLGVGDLEQNKLTIYPNPSTGIFHIKTNIPNPNYSIKTMLGQILEKGVLRNNILNLSNYATGIYFLELSSEEGRLVKKIVLE